MIRIQDPDPDPSVRGMDPRIRMHTNMSWIRNTAQGGARRCGPRQRRRGEGGRGEGRACAAQRYAATRVRERRRRRTQVLQVQQIRPLCQEREIIRLEKSSVR
jgi:hypothetical protein